MITIHHWNGTCCDHTGIEGLPESAAAVPLDAFVWVDMSAPTPEEEAAVLQKFLSVHPLTLEDVTRVRREPDQGAHFPKVEEFPDYLFVIVNPLPPGLTELATANRPRAADAPSAAEASSIALSTWRSWFVPASMPTWRFFTTIATTIRNAVPVSASGGSLKVAT